MGKGDKPVDKSFNRTQAIVVRSAANIGLSNASVKLSYENNPESYIGITDVYGYVAFLVHDPNIPGSLNARLSISLSGYKDYFYTFVAAPANQDVNVGGTLNTGNNPILIPGLEPNLDTTVGCLDGFVLIPKSVGPDNGAIFINEYDVVDDPNERARWRSGILENQIGIIPVGPIYAHGYDGQYPDTNWIDNPQEFIDRCRELKNLGCKLRYFMIPDSWNGPHGSLVDNKLSSTDQLDKVLGPIYSDPNFINFFDEFCIAWEPDWFSSAWVRAASWCRKFIGDKNLYYHLQPDHSAPGDSSEDEAACVRNIAPFISGQLHQSSHFGNPDYVDGSKRTRVQAWLYDLNDIARRFYTGYAGWPQVGYQNKQLELHAFEYASYWIHHSSNPNAVIQEAKKWGDTCRTIAPYNDPDNGVLIDLKNKITTIGDSGTAFL